jgi:hypothetical protein
MLAQKPTTQANEASMDEYLSMQMTSQPYQQLAFLGYRATAQRGYGCCIKKI